MTTEEIKKIFIYKPKYQNLSISKDAYTEDNKLRFKLRSLNLIKHNPNLFNNRGSFLNMIGSERSLIMIASFAFLLFGYRKRINAHRGYKGREGIWNNIAFSMFGATYGMIYASLFFVNSQAVINDYFAQYIFKRYKGSDKIDKKNIYALKDVECRDDVYNYTNSYFRNYHIHL